MGAAGSGMRGQAFGYYGGLDGLRALAIIAVLVYHGGVTWATGGFLGVEAFFVLSGFLITSLLVSEWRKTSTIALGAFWARRARRLLPALFVLVSVIGLHQMLSGPEAAVPGLKGDGIATLLYYGNWHQIATQSNYFAATGPVSPLEHTWSLAIEEQFYICWPLIFLGGLWLGCRTLCRRVGDRERALRMMLAIALVGIVASVVDVLLQWDGGGGINRVYYGTDTRAVSILTGAALALGVAVFGVAGRLQARPSSPRRGRIVGAAALVALLVVLTLMYTAEGGASWLYPYGFVALDLAVAVMIAAVVFFPASSVGRLFSLRPLRGIGQISYGVYLWHFPLYLWLTTDSTGLSGTPLLLFRIAVVLVVSVVSFYVVEQPIRRRRLPTWLVRSLSPVAAGAALTFVLIASTAASAPAGVTVAPPKSAAHLRGIDPPCRVLLRDTDEYGLAPMSPNDAAKTQPKWLAARRLKWSGSKHVTFRTCPPKKVLLVGDSLAFSMGLGMMIGEQQYGVEIANAAILGCSFGTRGEILGRSGWEKQRPGCATALTDWARLAHTFDARVVLVELGIRDASDWRWGGKVRRLGDAEFDSYIQRQIDGYVEALARHGVKVLFLAVPRSQPAALENGSPAPAGSAARHRVINSMLKSTVSRYPDRAGFVDLDTVVSPGNRYHARVHGQLCRFDGLHFTIYCGQLLQAKVMAAVRSATDS